MAQFLFYVVRDDGVIPTFEARECDDAAAAYETAEQLLGEHTTASAIEVWEGGKLLIRVKQRIEPIKPT